VGIPTGHKLGIAGGKLEPATAVNTTFKRSTATVAELVTTCNTALVINTTSN
jgi:hypothetical protein